MRPSFYLYRSSAGSGKTRTLAKEYMRLALAGPPDYYRHVLAVTFTNKATQEMKDRVLGYLYEFSRQPTGSLADELMQDLGWTPAQLQQKSAEVLSGILHHYSQFAISTIDAFFQRVIRSFTREAGILGNFRLEAENEVVLEEVLGLLMDELGQNKQLTQWVVDFSNDRLREGGNWNVRMGLLQFLQEIFKEDFKVVEKDVLNPSRDIVRERELLQKFVRSYFDDMKSPAQRALQIVSRHGLGKEDFNYGDSGTPLKYFQKFAQGEYYGASGARIQGPLVSSSDWPKKGRNAALVKDLAERELMPILQQMVAYDKVNGKRYRTADLVLEKYYAFGLITDITRKLRDYKEENNLMLLSDASQFLNGIINESDTPFIYEKVGTYFHHYLMDEFQDTSRLQWKNFIPLLREAADQGNSNLIVGDVKQSIYRWRGGELELLQQEVVNEFGKERVQVVPLNVNFRSLGAIVDFNNDFFVHASKELGETISSELPSEVYGDVKQGKSKAPAAGFVRACFKNDEEGIGWEDQVMMELPGWIERLQDTGVPLRDVAILVRKNDEGQRIANYLLRYRHSSEAKPGYRYDVVSNESLRLDLARSVNVLVSAMRYLKNPDDAIARGQLTYELSQNRDLDRAFAEAKLYRMEEWVPAEFLKRGHVLRKLSLFELTEELIRMFNLGQASEELAYLQAFQDTVLEFSSRERTDLGAFLEWWETYKTKKSIQVSASVDAINILTIHKSKGLQFKVVIVPFCNWSLNHENLKSPLLWPVAEEDPFRQLGPVVVKYSHKNLQDTIFAEEGQTEFVKVNVDNLNLLYVAFTRAEQGLILYARQPGAKLTTVGDLMGRVLRESPMAVNMTNDCFEIGEVAYQAEPTSKDSFAIEQLAQYQSVDWRKKLVIKRQGSEFFDDEISEKRARINRGILVHQLLSRIQYKSDAPDVIEQFMMETSLPKEEADALRDDLMRVLDHPQIGSWFTRDWKVKNEALILLPGREQKRIDRILFGASRTVLIDYKTGKKKHEDKEQVERYASVLMQMGYPNVQAYLLYLNDLRIVEVMNNSNFSLF